MRHSLLIVLFGCLAASQAKANLLLNGGFELPVCTSVTGICDMTVPANWTLVAGSVDPTSSWWQAQQGTQSLDLNGDHPGTISQNFATVAGGRYSLTFWLAGNPDGNPKVKTLNVLVGPSGGSLSILGSPSFNTTGHTDASMGYVPVSFSFTAGIGQTLTTLEFQSTTTDPNNPAFGPVLDNVDVEVVPEPASFLLLLAGTGLLALRRRIAR